MTQASDSPPQVFESVNDAIRALRASGLRLSTARRLILDALFSADGPVSAAHLSRMLSLDESSVYRNLELLEQRGVVRHLHLGHSPGLYVLTSEQDVEYLYCERCAKVTAVTPERLDPVRDRVRQEFGYTPRFTHFAIVGICQDCAAAPAASAPQQAHLHSHGGYVHSHPGRPRHEH